MERGLRGEGRKTAEKNTPIATSLGSQVQTQSRQGRKQQSLPGPPFNPLAPCGPTPWVGLPVPGQSGAEFPPLHHDWQLTYCRCPPSHRSCHSRVVWGMRRVVSDAVFDKCCKNNPITEIFVILATAVAKKNIFFFNKMVLFYP